MKAIEPDDPALKIPHMGWNTLSVINDHPLLAGIGTGAHGLDADSCTAPPRHAGPVGVVAEADDGGPVTAMVGRDNIAGTQFHPEKSQALGLRLIATFLQWRPERRGGCASDGESRRAACGEFSTKVVEGIEASAARFFDLWRRRLRAEQSVPSYHRA